MNDRIIIGIDPGVTGAIALMRYEEEKDEWSVHVHDMPIYSVVGSNNKKRRWCDPKGIAFLLGFPYTGVENLIVYCEHVHAQPLNGSIASFSLGHSLGTIQAVCALCDAKLELISPQRWKQHFNLLRQSKEKSLQVARDLFPQIELHKAKHHNRAEALLIGQYGAYAAGRDFID